MDEQSLPRPEAVAARESYCLWLRYDDGASGEVDLSHLVGKGVFTAWNDRSFFQNVRITPHCSIAWGEGDELELCPDALYMEITGKTVNELMPGFQSLPTNINV